VVGLVQVGKNFHSSEKKQLGEESTSKKDNSGVITGLAKNKKKSISGTERWRHHLNLVKEGESLSRERFCPENGRAQHRNYHLLTIVSRSRITFKSKGNENEEGILGSGGAIHWRGAHQTVVEPKKKLKGEKGEGRNRKKDAHVLMQGHSTGRHQDRFVNINKESSQYLAN